jgi:hypothetical protein
MRQVARVCDGFSYYDYGKYLLFLIVWIRIWVALFDGCEFFLTPARLRHLQPSRDRETPARWGSTWTFIFFVWNNNNRAIRSSAINKQWSTSRPSIYYHRPLKLSRSTVDPFVPIRNFTTWWVWRLHNTMRRAFEEVNFGVGSPYCRVDCGDWLILVVIHPPSYWRRCRCNVLVIEISIQR